MMGNQTLSGRSVEILLALGAAVAIAACGGGGGANTTGAGAGAGAGAGTSAGGHAPANATHGAGGGQGGTTTTEVTLSAFRFRSSNGTASTYVAPSKPDTGDPTDADGVFIEFYGSGFDPSNDGENTGTFDLSLPGDDNLATCSRCVSLRVDPAAMGRLFFQKSGTLVVDAGSDQVNGTVKGKLTDVLLIEVDYDESTGESTPVPNGRRVHIASADVAYTKKAPPAGWTCDESFYDDTDCDCGCGAVDFDCKDAKGGSCQYCDLSGSCDTAVCPGTIDPTNNAVCK